MAAEDVVGRGLVEPDVWEACQRIALALFEHGQKLARERGLILVDTKYEFGLADGELYVIDEIHTPDSSRFWEAAEYEERFARGEDQRMLDKENIRKWLIEERGYMGEGPAPEIPTEVRVDLAKKYVANYERLTGKPFEPAVGDPNARLVDNLRKAGIL